MLTLGDPGLGVRRGQHRRMNGQQLTSQAAERVAAVCRVDRSTDVFPVLRLSTVRIF